MTADSRKSKAQRNAFLEDGALADQAMRRSGVGYAASDVHAYVTALAAGHASNRPKAVRWRKRPTRGKRAACNSLTNRS